MSAAGGALFVAIGMDSEGKTKGAIANIDNRAGADLLLRLTDEEFILIAVRRLILEFHKKLCKAHFSASQFPRG